MRREYADATTVELAGKLGRTVSAVQRCANDLGVKKSLAFLQHEAEKMLEPGRATRFGKGHVPWTKGRKGFKPSGRSHEHQFKKKHVPHNHKPVGATRVKLGYLQKKVTDTGDRRDWKFVHILLWEAHNGPVPAGAALTFRDGDPMNITLSNLELIKRRELMRRNSITRFPKPVRQVMNLTRKLRKAIDEKQDRGSA